MLGLKTIKGETRRNNTLVQEKIQQLVPLKLLPGQLFPTTGALLLKDDNSFLRQFVPSQLKPYANTQMGSRVFSSVNNLKTIARVSMIITRK